MFDELLAQPHLLGACPHPAQHDLLQILVGTAGDAPCAYYVLDPDRLSFGVGRKEINVSQSPPTDVLIAPPDRDDDRGRCPPAAAALDRRV